MFEVPVYFILRRALLLAYSGAVRPLLLGLRHAVLCVLLPGLIMHYYSLKAKALQTVGLKPITLQKPVNVNAANYEKMCSAYYRNNARITILNLSLRLYSNEIEQVRNRERDFYTLFHQLIEAYCRALQLQQAPPPNFEVKLAQVENFITEFSEYKWSLVNKYRTAYRMRKETEVWLENSKIITRRMNMECQRHYKDLKGTFTELNAKGKKLARQLYEALHQSFEMEQRQLQQTYQHLTRAYPPTLLSLLSS